MFSQTFINCLPEIKEVIRAKGQKRIQLLKDKSKRKCFYLALRELAHNVAIQSIKIPPRGLKKLARKPNRLVAYKLSKGVKGVKNKKMLVNQSGGFLMALAPFLPLIVSAATSLLSK
jgi:hypothetical protein